MKSLAGGSALCWRGSRGGHRSYNRCELIGSKAAAATSAERLGGEGSGSHRDSAVPQVRPCPFDGGRPGVKFKTGAAGLQAMTDSKCV